MTVAGTHHATIHRTYRAVMLTVLLCAGCSSETQFGAGNYRLLASLHTAVSAKRTDWLDAAARVIAERRASGQLNDQQSTQLEAIVAKARSGDWQGAEQDVVRLQKGQRATEGGGERQSAPAP